MENKRSNGLIALCILSGIYIIFNLFSQIVELASGPLTDEEIREQKLEIMSDQSDEVIEVMGAYIEEMVATLERTQQYHYQITGANTLIYLLGAIGVWMLFRRQKMGFHLYLSYNILEIAAALYFFGQFTISFYVTLFMAVISIVFIILYWQQVKNFSTSTNEIT